LLMFLAVHPDGVTREALTAALWPDSPPARITNALHTGLSRLRRATRSATRGTLGDIVLVGHGRFRLDPSLVAVDYQRFVDARHAHRAAGDDPRRQAALRAMVDTYVGPFAEGMSSEWIETLRESLRREVLDALAALARARIGADPEEALQLLEIACGFDPHNELRYCDIMRLQARLGRREAIPRTLAVLTARLAELGEQPDPEVIELAHRLTHPHSPARATPGSAATSNPATDPRPRTRGSGATRTRRAEP
jgi:DNA-binding SARP family transcriptional activator